MHIAGSTEGVTVTCGSGEGGRHHLENVIHLEVHTATVPLETLEADEVQEAIASREESNFTSRVLRGDSGIPTW